MNRSYADGIAGSSSKSPTAGIVAKTDSGNSRPAASVPGTKAPTNA